MHPKPIIVQFQRGELIAIPAVHFHHVFANEANRICRDPELRPDVIAVELGPLTAQAAASWLKELGQNGKASEELPVMLGLMKPNRMIRASFRKKSFELQRKTGKDLSELDPEILHRELGFSGYRLLCLTPTDSIIEAIRCSLELEIPLYGVDLEEMADGDHCGPVIQDPIGADGDVAAYVGQNAVYAGGQRDKEVDVRREIAMAARLKGLLTMYRKVLFTCGMGHWVHVLKHLADPSIRPATVRSTDEKTNGNFRRVVVHPQLAINYMGLFPALVCEYQKMRRPVNVLNRLDNTIPLNPQKIFENLMKEVYEKHFCAEAGSESFLHPKNDLASLGAFENYLSRISLLNLRPVPDIFTTARTAREMMSKSFQKAIIKKFVEFPWASPQEYPGCNFLCPSSSRGNSPACKLREQDGAELRDYFYIRSVPENRTCRYDEIYFEWKVDKTSEKPRRLGIVHTWGPWANLISAVCLRGISMAKKWEHEKSVEPFSGSFLSGIAVKEVIRAYARGEDRLYVYDTVKKKRPTNASFTEGFPVVFLLEPVENKGSRWAALFIDFSWVSEFIRNRPYFEDVRGRRGSKMISMIGYGDHGVQTKVSRKNHSVRTDRYYGMTIYQPDCWEMEQFARWMEMTAYKRNPYCRSNLLDKNYPSDLKASLESEYGIRMGEYDWPTTLILLAIPFAKKTVTVIAPDQYQFNPVVSKNAKNHGIEVQRVSLHCLSPQEKERLSLNHMAPVINQDLLPKAIFHRSVEKAIGELQTDNRHLVPKACLNFGKY